MPERFDDLPVLAGLGASLRAAMAEAEAAEAPATVAEPLPASPEGASDRAPQAARPDRHTRRWRRGPRSFGALSTVLVLGVVGTAAAAATLTVLRGSPIPAPRSADLQPVMTAKAETLRVLDLRAPDPSGGTVPPFALRTGTSQGGLTCVTVGQVDDGQFGIVGTDGRFRELPPTLIDGCGKETGRGPAVAGARILESKDYDRVRSVVYGFGGPELRRATLEVRGRERPLAVENGAFLTALRGYPDDSALRLRLTFDHGRTTTHPLGVGPMTVVDPVGRAWKLESTGVESGDRMVATCVRIVRARFVSDSPGTANVCDRTRDRAGFRPRHRVWFDVRTFQPGDRGRLDRRFPIGWSWGETPARTIVWGYADPRRTRSITATATDGARALIRPTDGGAFAAVFDGVVPSAGMRVTVLSKDGRRSTHVGPVLPIGRKLP